MSLFVNTNTTSLGAQRAIANINPNLNQVFNRLSSGSRINSAADDAAGLQISNRLTSQINGINQGIKNANDAISLAQVAEGAFEEMTNSIQRARSLVIQSRNGALSQQDKIAVDGELRQISLEINRISETTSFAGIPLLDGKLNKDFLIGANAGEKININLEREEGWSAFSLRLAEVDVTGVLGINTLKVPGIDIAGQTRLTIPNPAISGRIVGLEVSLNGGDFKPIEDSNTGNPEAPSPPDQGVLTFGINAQENMNSFISAINNAVSPTAFNVDIDPVTNSFLTPSGQSLRFRITGISPNEASALAKQAEVTQLTGLNAEQLGKGSFNIVPPEEGDLVTRFHLEFIDQALKDIDNARAELGATQNKLGAAIRNLSNIEENVSSARSRILDTDYSKESAELVRLQILQQATNSVLAQANQRPQAALSLLQ